MMRSSVAVALLLVALSATCVFGLVHEDEIGQRDWYVANVGRVEHSGFFVSPYVKHVLVASDEGVVAALAAMDKGTIRWRHHLVQGNDTIACFKVSQNAVSVVTSSGVGYLLHPASGALSTTFAVGLSRAAVVGSCAFESDASPKSLRVASYSGSSVYITDLPLDDAELLATTTIPPTHEFTTSAPVTAVDFAAQAALLWVELPSGIHTYDIRAKTVSTSSVKGHLISSSATPAAGHALVSLTSEEGTAFKIVEQTSSGVTVVAGEDTPTCKQCRASLIEGLQKTIVVAARDELSDSTFDLYIGGKKVTVEYPGSYVPRIVAARASTNSAKQRVDIVLRATNSHLLFVTVSDGSATIQWERLEGITAPAYTKVVALPKINSTQSDTFGFDVDGLILSRYGTLYRVPVSKSGENITVVADVALALYRLGGKSECICGAVFKGFTVDDSGIARIAVVHKGLPVWIDVNVMTGEIVGASNKIAMNGGSTAKSTLFISSDLSVLSDLTVVRDSPSDAATAPQYLYTIDATKGAIQGLLVQPSAKTAISTWSINLGSPVVAMHSPTENPLLVSTVHNLRVFPNTSTKEKTQEIRRKYPTHNILAVATTHQESSHVTITVLDVVTGSILSTSNIPSASGPVHILVVEHAVIVHFLNVERLRYAVAVLELFEQEDNSVPLEATGASLPQVIASFFVGKKSFSSRTSRPPVVALQVLAFPGGSLDAMTATTSYQSINRKQVVFALSDGRVHAVDLRQLLFGGQFNPQKPEEVYEHVALPSINVISHIHHVLKAQNIAVTPTELESSAHVLVAGVDLLYARVSLGKAFDMLNEDFNHELLITVTIVMGILTLVARHFASRKILRMAWA